MNKNLFQKAKAVAAPGKNTGALTQNDAGGRAYVNSAEYALALYAVCGTFNGTFYASGETHLERVTELLPRVSNEFVARCAVAGADAGMKDVPVFLTAYLMAHDVKLFEAVFTRVIRRGKTLSTFLAMVRSGKAGRKSLGSAPKRVISKWLTSRSGDELFRTSIGVANPGVADVIRAVHPRAETDEQVALMGYLSGKNLPEYATTAKDGYRVSSVDKLPPLVREVEAFRKDPSHPVPNVDFRALSSVKLTNEHWREIAARMSYVQVLKNLNTMVRHGVLSDSAMVDSIARKIASETELKRARVFPYELLAAYRNADVEQPIRSALHKAVDNATANLPEFTGKVVVCPDTSGSMSSPVTGGNGKTASKVSCVDVAALVSAAVLRRNTSARVMPFDTNVHDARSIVPEDSILTNAERLARFGGGGTDCSQPLAALNRENAMVDLVIYVSDNESWADRGYYRGTGMMTEWKRLKARCPSAKLVCIDITPNPTGQVQDDPDILRIGGFSDAVFDMIALFASGAMGGDALTERIHQISL